MLLSRQFAKDEGELLNINSSRISGSTVEDVEAFHNLCSSLAITLRGIRATQTPRAPPSGDLSGGCAPARREYFLSSRGDYDCHLGGVKTLGGSKGDKSSQSGVVGGGALGLQAFCRSAAPRDLYAAGTGKERRLERQVRRRCAVHGNLHTAGAGASDQEIILRQPNFDGLHYWLAGHGGDPFWRVISLTPNVARSKGFELD